MKKSLVILTLGLTVGCLFGQGRQTLAVDKVKATDALMKDLAGDKRGELLARVVQSMDRQLIAAITTSRKFMVVGRQDLQAILDEQDLGASGIVADDTAAAPGEVKGAKYKLVASVDSFQETTERATFSEVEKLKRRFQVSAQSILYDTSTAEVIDTANIQVEKVDIIDIQPGASDRAGGRTDELIPLLGRELAAKTTARLIAILFPAKVIDVEDNVLTINQGEEFFAVGDTIKLFSAGKTVTDPDTGETFKIKGKQMGTAKITAVDPATAQATYSGTAAIAVGTQVSK